MVTGAGNKEIRSQNLGTRRKKAFNYLSIEPPTLLGRRTFPIYTSVVIRKMMYNTGHVT
jgi:hypothetical protein